MSQLSLFDASPMTASQPVDLLIVKGGRPEVLYRNPTNEHQAWTGRGKPPRWVTEWVQGGKSLEALMVSGTKL